VRPRTELVDPALLADDGGVLVDQQMRTADPAVFAAGDIATIENPLYGKPLRSEHWANALMSGQIAARSLLGLESEFDPVPFFFTDQYDLFVEYVGHVSSHEHAQLVIRGDLQDRAFQAFWLEAGRVVAAMHVNRRDEGIVPLQELIRSGNQISSAALADPDVPLVDLAQR